MAAFIELAGAREGRERAALLGLHAMAARGDWKEVRKRVREGRK